MADTIFTRALAQAAARQGSTQALAYQMPLQGFRRVIELLVEHEKSPSTQAPPQDAAPGEKLDFNIGEVFARCARCGGTQFAPAVPVSALRMTSMVLCCSCTFSGQHGELLAELASQAIQHSRAVAALRKRRSPARQPAAKVIRLARRS
jgi:hypothetical protein